MKLNKQRREQFFTEARLAVGANAVITRPGAMSFYTTGWRSGAGTALAVLKPSCMRSLWQSLRLCVENQCAIIMQAANTGLTEGSTPSGDDYDRDVVVISTLKLAVIHWLPRAKQVVCLPGATLHQLTDLLDQYDRVPHSEIGSSCIGASVIGGVANNSGGALIKRGPAYTECSLYAQVTDQGKLGLVNSLGLDLRGDDDEKRMYSLESGDFLNEDTDYLGARSCSARDYEQTVRDTSKDTPARYNADTSQLHGASGCAGKVAVLAVKLDTFPKPSHKTLFYLGTSSTTSLQRIRKEILGDFQHLPDKAEYMHIDCMRLANSHGRDSVFLLRILGTARMPEFFRLKNRIEQFCKRIPGVGRDGLERLLQRFAALLPCQIPKELRAIAENAEHQLLIETSDSGVEELRNYLTPERCREYGIDLIECSPDSAAILLLHRFAAAGSALRYSLTNRNQVQELVSLDIALPRNTEEWFDILPSQIEENLVSVIYYGHFFCHVFHQDYLIKKGNRGDEIKHALLKHCAARGAKYPAEHNVGHVYQAEDSLTHFYQTIDPTNTFNPGIGGMSKTQRYL